MARLAIFALCVMLAAAPAEAATGTATTSKPKTTTTAKASGASTRARTTTTRSGGASVTVSDPDVPTPSSIRPRSGGEDSTMTMHGGQEGTVFKSLTVEGEDRIHLDFDRPELKVELDPTRAPGLDWGSARDVLDRTAPDLATPLVMQSAHEPSPYVAHPWLSHFASGAVARFRPNLTGVASWKLAVVDARGETVATYSGQGEPPREIAWNGRSQGGAPVVPGLTYSYVLEAHDKAGNKRNFVGQGFKVNAYRLDTPEGPMMVLSAQELPAMTPGRAVAVSAATTPPILIEAASWLNQRDKPNQPVRVTATAKSYEAAQALADFVIRSMTPQLIGDPARMQAVAEVQADAPEGGTIKIASARQ
jgi:hypothetical protein